MQAKDYYKILELPPSATLKEIKAAWRRLAHQYHPDKNNNDLYAAAQFEIIKEAYEVLSNPSRKEYYLQQRWYDQGIGKKNKQTVVTPVTVLQQMLELDKYVSRLDVHRMDKEGLYTYIIHILSDETIKKLNTFNEADTNKAIIDSAIKAGHVLPWVYARPLSERLMKLNAGEESLKSIDQYTLHSKRSARWNKYKPGLVFLLVLFICLLIYLISH